MILATYNATQLNSILRSTLPSHRPIECSNGGNVYHVIDSAKSTCLEHLKMCFFTVQKVITLDHELTQLRQKSLRSRSLELLNKRHQIKYFLTNSTEKLTFKTALLARKPHLLAEA